MKKNIIFYAVAVGVLLAVSTWLVRPIPVPHGPLSDVIDGQPHNSTATISTPASLAASYQATQEQGTFGSSVVNNIASDIGNLLNTEAKKSINKHYAGDTAVPLETLNWTPPVTDTAWREEIKANAFDIRSDEVILVMLASHKQKLANELEEYQLFADCPECVTYEAKKNLEAYELSRGEIETEATKQFAESQNNALLSIERLKKAVLLLEKEKEFRKL